MCKSSVIDKYDYQNNVFYLILPDKEKIIIAIKDITASVNSYWRNPQNATEIKEKSKHFEICNVCDNKQRYECTIRQPLLTYNKTLDKFKSYDNVTVVLRKNQTITYLNTTMQNALTYFAILNLIQFCETGIKYSKFFHDLSPLHTPIEVTQKLFLQIYKFCNEDISNTKKIITDIKKDLKAICTLQVKRLNNICQNDALMNAFVNTQIILELLSINILKDLEANNNKSE